MATVPADRRAFRCRVLADSGAVGAVVSELLEYNERPFHRHVGTGPDALPLRDEPHLRAWSDYEARAAEVGVFGALRERFFQLQFPIREGISEDEDYRRATRRGLAPPAGSAAGLELNRPQDLQLVLNPTLAGRVPLLVVPDREDFVALVRAFTERNEPVAVPDSMGACTVNGFNNWDRIARYREKWRHDNAERPEAGTWEEEFVRLVPRKELYQDRFIILSTGPYSFVPAAAVGLAEKDWLRKSLVIRREHECMHYLTHRVLGSMKNNLQDEVIADFVGLLHAFGTYSSYLALRFFGLEAYPVYRQGGRLETYMGVPPLSEPAAAVVRTLVFRAVRNLEALAQTHPPRLRGASGITRLALALADLTLEELASPEMPSLLEKLPAPTEPEAPGPEEPRDSLWVDLGTSDEGMARLLHEFDRFSRAHPRLADVRGDMSLALDELVSNVLHHGYDHEECTEGHEHLILVGMNVHPQHLEVQIIDDAKCFSPLEAPDPDLAPSLEDRPIGGLGIHLVRSLMDEMEYRRYAGRNHLLMRKKLARA
jgi:anti-sigma regulatory factor (Ser/Thr protein kinase)